MPCQVTASETCTRLTDCWRRWDGWKSEGPGMQRYQPGECGAIRCRSSGEATTLSGLGQLRAQGIRYLVPKCQGQAVLK